MTVNSQPSPSSPRRRGSRYAVSRPGSDERFHRQILRGAQFALRRAEVEIGDDLFVVGQPQALGHASVVGQLTGTPYRTDTLGMGSQQNAVGGTAGGQHLFLRRHL